MSFLTIHLYPYSPRINFQFKVIKAVDQTALGDSPNIDQSKLWLQKLRLKMSPEKLSYIFYSRKINKLSLILFGKQIPYTDPPVFLGIKFDQSLCFNSLIEFIRSRYHDRIVEINGVTITLKIYHRNTTVFCVSQTKIQKLLSIYHLPYDTPSFQLSGLLEVQKVERIESRLRILLENFNFNSSIKEEFLFNLYLNFTIPSLPFVERIKSKEFSNLITFKNRTE
ncbi:hypothetical protein BpHYR1_041586 [Brachionus plicatilis]|uniref:RNA-directed DNA polymerase from mobile element jockey-like n=1 Tax=Brachionus plicatilis TaxID=10195 RepID=A0A3M7SRZ6_BRAPC|nr:hypothetical protein BpHYR1_041586 [Brachionus plicatilis]